MDADSVIYAEPEVESYGWDESTISREDSNELAMFNLIPKGTYPGVVVKVTPKKITTEQGLHPLEGKTIAKLDILLTADTRNYHLFADAYPEVIKAKSKSGGTYIRAESDIATQLFDALEMHGQPFTKVLAAAQEETLKYVVRIVESKDPQYKPKNAVKIYAYRQ